jgi:hypothetical protein
MRQLTIHIPDRKFQYVMDLLSNLSFVKIDQPTDNFIITEEQKRMCNEEFRKMEEDPDYALDWDEVKHLL